jgi:hypothetical protein
LYVKGLRSAGVGSSLFKRFMSGYIGTAAVYQEPPPRITTPTTSKSNKSRRKRN